jgi:periplasmic protein TonB
MNEALDIRPLPGKPWKDLLPAALCTGLVFAVLPFIELLQAKPPGEVALYRVESIRLPPQAQVPPPPPPAEASPPDPVEREEVSLFEDALEPLHVEARLDMPPWQPGFTPETGAGYRLEAGPAPRAPETFGLGDLDEIPQVMVRVPPAYPPRARLRGMEGVVVVEFVVRPDGRTDEIRVVEAHPQGWFEDAARRAVQRWTFRPGMRGGQPVPVRLRQQIRFELDTEP